MYISLTEKCLSEAFLYFLSQKRLESNYKAIKYGITCYTLLWGLANWIHSTREFLLNLFSFLLVTSIFCFSLSVKREPSSFHMDYHLKEARERIGRIILKRAMRSIPQTALWEIFTRLKITESTLISFCFHLFLKNYLGSTVLK